MTEMTEGLRTSEVKEQLDAHMVDMKFGIPELGVDYHKLMNLGESFMEFREADGEELGVISMGAHIDTQEDVLRVVVHIDGYLSNVQATAEYVVGAVAKCGVKTPYTMEVTTLSQAS